MRRTHGVAVITSAAALALAGATMAPGASAAPTTVSGYIVVLDDGAGPPASVADRLANRYGGQVGYVYEYALRGFYIRTTERAAVALASNPNVDYVEAESPVAVDDQTTPTGIRRTYASSSTAIDIDGSDDSRVDVDVAVLDTGIDLDNSDLAVAGSVSCVNVSSVSACSGAGDDMHGHGTHVAGTIAAIDDPAGVVGMAPGARLWSVKVLGDTGSGSNAGVAAGLDWVVGHNDTTSDYIEVANLSLGGGYSSVMNDAVARATSAGVSVVVAAGNDGRNAGNYSPASAPSAITVSALADFNGLPNGGAGSTCYPDTDDTFANFSNYGQVVDIIAPGVCILSTAPGGGTATKNGTSMASPHVAGAAALLRSAGFGRASTESLLKEKGNFDWTGNPDSWQEPLLDVRDSVFTPRFVGAPAPPANEPPVASFSWSCTGLTCTFVDTSTDSNGGTIVTRSWDFGDGSTGAGPNPSHTYPGSATYLVKLTVTDNAAATDDETQSVTATAPSVPQPGFVATSTRTGKSSWKATIAVSSAQPGTLVNGTWTWTYGTTSGSARGGCTPGSTGTCNFALSKISTGISRVTWTWDGGGNPVQVDKP